MLIPIAGILWQGLEYASVPLPLKELRECDNTNYIKNGFTDDEMRKRFDLYQQSVENISHTDVYNVKIERIKPIKGLLGDSLAVGNFLSMWVKSVNLALPYMGRENVKTGAKKVSHFTNEESGELEIEFYNPSEALAEYYFLKDKDGNNIQPKDGTVLLPLEYYFKVEVYKWVIREGFRTKSYYVNGYYQVAGNLSFNFESESEELQTFSITLSSLKTGGVID